MRDIIYSTNPNEKYRINDNITGEKKREIRHKNLNNADEDKIDRELELKFEKFQRNMNENIRDLIYQTEMKEKHENNDRKFNNEELRNAGENKNANMTENKKENKKENKNDIDNEECENENENENENIYDRDASSCPFAVSLQDENYPFVDIALSMYDNFGVRTESGPRSLLSVTDVSVEELLRSSSGLLDDEKRGSVRGRERGSDRSSLYGKLNVGDDCNLRMNKNKNCGELNEGENKLRVTEINSTDKYFKTHEINTKSEIIHGDENYDIDISGNNVHRNNNVYNFDQKMRCVQINNAFKTAFKVQKVLISLISEVSVNENDGRNKNTNNCGSNVVNSVQNKNDIDVMRKHSQRDTVNENTHSTKTNDFNKNCEKNTSNYDNNSSNENNENRTNVFNKSENQNKVENESSANIVNKQLIKEFIDYLSSKSSCYGQKLVGKNSASVLASIDFVEFFLFFLDIQVILQYR